MLLLIFMSVIMQSVAFSIVTPSAVTPHVVMLRVIMLTVVTPLFQVTTVFAFRFSWRHLLPNIRHA